MSKFKVGNIVKVAVNRNPWHKLVGKLDINRIGHNMSKKPLIVDFPEATQNMITKLKGIIIEQGAIFPAWGYAPSSQPIYLMVYFMAVKDTMMGKISFALEIK